MNPASDSPDGSVQLLYFAWLRERVGSAEEMIALPAGVGTVAALLDWLAARDERHAAAFAQRGLLRCAVNQNFAALDTKIAAGDEIAFFPPVTGG
jgi:molybdopterin converting factor subunit 1